MIPQKLKEITSELRNETWIQEMARNSEIYVVGGSVRDAYIGKPMKDIDLIVDGLSIEGILKILKKFGNANLHGESFAVIKFKPTGYEGEDYDVAVPREDKKIGKGHKGFEIVTDGVDVHGDLKRRDFTLNSMAVNVMDDKLLDPFNGLDDLKSGVLKATDEKAFADDPLRILRGIQFAARFGFDIHPNTMKLMQDYAPEVKEIAGERIYDEFEKILNKEGDTQLALNLLHKTGVDEALFDKKMLHYEEGMDHLDPISFYYILGLVGDVDPFEFYMRKLEGSNTNKVGTAIQVLDNLLLKWESSSEVERKYMVMKAITKVPKIADIALTPGEMDDIILDMRLMRIPMNPSDVLIDGDEIQAIFGIPKSKKVGEVLEKTRKAALMNEFDWKDKDATLDYVSNLAK
jgi:tRNA nucleotidyltransferase/poly(A) polymerase